MADATFVNRLRPLFSYIALIALIWVFTGCASEDLGGVQRVEIGGETFELELALTRETRFRGLSGRVSIPADGGMLFVFPQEAPRAFVMRECLVPIDILFLNPRGQVLNTHAMQVEPPGTPESQLKRYASQGQSSLVIELAGGTVQRLGVEAGDRIDLPVLELKRRAR